MAFENRTHKLHFPITGSGGVELSEVTVKAPSWVVVEKASQLAAERNTPLHNELTRLCIRNGTEGVNNAHIDEFHASDMNDLILMVSEMCQPPAKETSTGKSDAGE